MAGSGEAGESIVYLNGEFVPGSEARISVFDHVVLYGDGVYDTMCAWNHMVFKLDEHVDRLFESAHAVKLEIPLGKKELKSVILETVRRNALPASNPCAPIVALPSTRTLPSAQLVTQSSPWSASNAARTSAPRTPSARIAGPPSRRRKNPSRKPRHRNTNLRASVPSVVAQSLSLRSSATIASITPVVEPTRGTFHVSQL